MAELAGVCIFFFFLMIRQPPRSTQSRSSAASDVYKRQGVDKFSGARVSAPDLRAGAALVIAGMAADGITIVDDIVYIQRGYERFEEKLRSLGAVIERVSTEREIQKFKLKVG